MRLFQIFSPNLSLSSSLDSVFHRAEVLNFNEVQLIIISFIDHAFGIVSRSSRFSPMSSSRRLNFFILPLGL